jgi:hypothetical protein
MGTDGEGWVSRRSEADLEDFEDFVFLCAKRRARKSFPPFLTIQMIIISSGTSRRNNEDTQALKGNESMNNS